MNEKIDELKMRFYNSWFWYHIYYKHTKVQKQNLKDTEKRVRDQLAKFKLENGIK